MTSTLERGYKLEEPQVTVPWGLSRQELVRMLSPHGLISLDNDNFMLSCKSLSGLSHDLHFRFDVEYGPKRYMLSLARPQEGTLRQSFDTFQKHLALTFGPPSSFEETEDGWPFYTWNVGTFIIHHAVIERFMAIEHVSITPPSFQAPLAVRCWRTLGYWSRVERFLLPRLFLLCLVPILIAVMFLMM